MSREWAFMERVDAPDYDRPHENYMTRWRVIGLPWVGLYVHRIDKPDPRPTLHDHPWPFLSLVVRGGYAEEVGTRAEGSSSGPVIGRRSRWWRQGSVHRMRKTDAHTIVGLRRSPTWTVVLVGRRARPEPSWGYWDEDGWTPFDQHPHAADFAAAEVARRATAVGDTADAEGYHAVAGRRGLRYPWHALYSRSRARGGAACR